MKNYPLGIQTFSEIRSGRYYYIDKTHFIPHLCDNKYFFLSRPRRFGKSLFLDTLKEAFSGNKELFSGLHLEKNWDWSKSFPVIKISFGGGVHKTADALTQAIHEILNENCRDLNINTTAKTISGRFREILETLNKKGKHVVVLIDEYDKPILDNIENPAVAGEVREVLKGFYSVLKDADPFLKLVFLTGVSKFSKVSIFSGLNNLTDISLDPVFSDICGYTQTELEKTFHEELNIFDKEKIKEWYNGYNFLGDSVYNPYDILNLFYHKRFKNYWFETGTPTFLIKLIQEKNYYIPDLTALNASEKLLNSFDIDNITLETILFQAGYLTITNEKEKSGTTFYTLGLPNREVRQSLVDYILDFLSKQTSIKVGNQEKVIDATYDQDLDKLKNVIHAFYASIPKEWYRSNTIANYEGYYTSVFYAYLTGAGLTTIPEDFTNKGRIDLTVDGETALYVFEFKVVEEDSTPGSALEQIKARGYAEKYMTRNKPVYIVGCEFSKEACNITRYEWEKVKEI